MFDKFKPIRIKSRGRSSSDRPQRVVSAPKDEPMEVFTDLSDLRDYLATVEKASDARTNENDYLEDEGRPRFFNRGFPAGSVQVSGPEPDFEQVSADSSPRESKLRSFDREVPSEEFSSFPSRGRSTAKSRASSRSNVAAAKSRASSRSKAAAAKSRASSRSKVAAAKSRASSRSRASPPRVRSKAAKLPKAPKIQGFRVKGDNSNRIIFLN